jgi:hypothetical protein
MEVGVGAEGAVVGCAGAQAVRREARKIKPRNTDANFFMKYSFNICQRRVDMKTKTPVAQAGECLQGCRV